MSSPRKLISTGSPFEKTMGYSRAVVQEEWLGNVRSAATMVIADLIEPDMKIEIEVTAFRG